MNLKLITLAVLAAFGLAADANAADYYVVTPVPGKTNTPEQSISATLNAAILPQGVAGEPYAYDLKQLLVVTGDPELNLAQSSWSALSTLPEGLTLSNNGELAGTPAQATSSTFSVRATYKTATGQQSYTLSVRVPISIALGTDPLPTATFNTAYSFDMKDRLTILGDPEQPDPGQSAWTAVSALPSGLTLSSSGILSGTPNQSGQSSFTVKATYKSKEAQRAYAFSVASPGAIIDFLAPHGTATQQLQSDNRTLYVSGNGYPEAQSTTCRSSGKYYWEATVNNAPSLYTTVGLAYPTTSNLTSRNFVARYYWGSIYRGATKVTSALDTSQKLGTYGVAVDADNKTVQFYWQGTAVYSPINYSAVSASACPLIGIQGYPSGTGSITANLGQEPFKYPVPAGYQAGWY